MTTPSKTTTERPVGRLFFGLGGATAVLGVVAYIIQFQVAHQLFAPWYLPITGTIGVLLMLIALWRRVRLMRILMLVPALLLAGAEWFVLAGRTLPEYTGPVATGQPFPAFTTTLADGTQLTQADLPGEQDTVMVFFRGRW